jgi:hypothetical protein
MKPLRRSLVFWAGLLVLACLLIGWANSMWQTTYLSAKRTEETFPGTSIVWISSRGKALLHVGILSGGSGPRDWSFEMDRTPDDITEDWPDGLAIESHFDDLVEHPLRHYNGEIACPYWLMAVAWIVGWLGFVIWRRRLLRRKLAATLAMAEADGA